MMNLNYQKSITPERYLQHKEYFDAGLIATFEKICLQNQKLTIENKEQRLKIMASKNVIRDSLFKIKTRDIEIHNLRARLQNNEADAEEIIKDIVDDFNNVVKEYDSEFQNSYEENARLHEENEQLREMIRKLRQKEKRSNLKLDSTNSSLPPSSDFGSKPKSMREKSGRSVGGQTGHKGNFSKLREKPNRVIKRTVKKAPKGAKPVHGDNQEILYYVTQEVDMKLSSVIVETQYFIEEEGAELSVETMKQYAINCVNYSSGFKAIMLYLNHKGAIAIDRLCAMVKEISNEQIEVKPGSIINWSKEFRIKSEPTMNEILNSILSSEIVHVDETGWKIDKKKAWMHCICSRTFAYFLVTKSRADLENGPIKRLENFKNTLVHDNFKSYYRIKCRHAECNAHIIRYLRRGWEATDDIGCHKMMKLLQSMLKYKKDCISEGKDKGDAKDIENFKQQYLAIARDTQERYFRNNPEVKPKTKYEEDHIKLMRRLEKNVEEHLLFLNDFKVPFENNSCERQIRSVKTKKKVSGQNKNLEHANDYAAIQSVIQTSNLQGKNTLKAIKDIFDLKS